MDTAHFFFLGQVNLANVNKIVQSVHWIIILLHLSLADTVSPVGSCLHTDQSRSASLNASCQNEEGSLCKIGTSDEPQLSTQDGKSQNNLAELPPVSTLFLLSTSRKFYTCTTPTGEIGISWGEGGGSCIKTKKK